MKCACNSIISLSYYENYMNISKIFRRIFRKSSKTEEQFNTGSEIAEQTIETQCWC